MSESPTSELETIYRMFAGGENPEQVAEAMNIGLQCAKDHYRQYLALPLSAKMQMTLLPQSVADRIHRLADDIRDLELLDARLAGADEKTLVSLLDMKRKIKERMAKDLEAEENQPVESDDAGIADRLAETYEKIFGGDEE